MLDGNPFPTPAVNCDAKEVRPGIETPPAAARIPRWKRVLDVTCVLASLPVLIPVGIIIALFIKIVSPGPAFFRQQRVGYYGRRFMCLKFRTMKVNADTSVHQAHLKDLVTGNGPTRKLDCSGDSRLVRGGLLLRSLGADELPQLINVLRGEMSLVGPRPCTPFEFELFSARHKRRCQAPPGLTGLWQISGKNKTTFEEMMNLDLGYVERCSLWLDLKVILLTLPAILTLVWEMRILPKLAGRRATGALQRVKPAFEPPAERPFAGTVPARK
jgi:lipopolysaccharide/colanic/teichoic acid biosynthesis glycosyltransferase